MITSVKPIDIFYRVYSVDTIGFIVLHKNVDRYCDNV